MQNFAINGGALNGDPEVWIEEAVASLSLQAAGDGMRGAMFEGSAAVELDADCDLLVWALLEGQASVELDATGEGLRWVMVEGQTPIEFAADGDIVVVEGISASFAVELRLAGDIAVAQAANLDGGSAIRLSASGSVGSAKTALLSGVAPLVFAGRGHGALVIDSPPGAAAIKLLAQGASRVGAKMPLEGTAVVALYARGGLGKFRYVFLEGAAAFEILAMAEKIGVPAIPGYYVEAPKIRTLRLTKEPRRFTVPAERRL